MKNEYKILNHVQTHLLTWGDPFKCYEQDIIVCITGNPGITGFYTDFGFQLFKRTGLPVCVIGHAGHEEVPDQKSNVLKGQEHLFNLKGQLEHKLDLINQLIDKHCRLHLIGHSIGAWLIVELINDNENLIKHLSSVNLLCPTLQKLAETKNGKVLNYIVRQLHLLFLFLFNLCYLLPAFIVTFLIGIYLKIQSWPQQYSKHIVEFLKPGVGEKVLYLAYNEMDTVKTLNTEVLERIKNVTNVIYSNRDNWAPVRYMHDLHVFQPQICLEELDVDHAFVLNDSEKVATLASNFIKLKLR